MKNTLETISQKRFVKEVILNKTIVRLFFIVCVFLLVYISYGRAFDYYFWRDDLKVAWMQRYVPALINNFDTMGTARGRLGAVIFDYLEYTFLGFESQPHQIFGFVLRFVNALIVFVFSYALTKSKRVAAMSALFAASFVGGLEAYSWVRGIGFMITLSLVAFTLYIKSYYKNNNFLYIVSIFIVAGAFSMDLWRTMGIIVVILLWEILQAMAKLPEANRKISYIRVFVFVVSLVSVFKFMLMGIGNANGSVAGSINGYLKMALSFETHQHFFISLGNLLRIPFLFVPEEGGIANGDTSSLVIGIMPLVFLIILSIIFLIRREKALIPWIILLVWIPLFYVPNWLYAQATQVASTHRYLAFSAIAIPILWAMGLSKLPAKLGAFIACLFIVFSLSHAVWVVNHDYLIRGRDFVLPYWKQIASDTPPGEANSMLSITGDNRVIGYVFAWSDVFPYGLLKGIRIPWELPIYANIPIAVEAICDPKSLVHDPLTGGTVAAHENFSIEKAHAWNIKYDKMIEVTDVFRVDVGKSAQCLWKDGVAVIPLKQKKDTYAILTSWKKSISSSFDFYYTVSVQTSGEKLPVDKSIGRVTYLKSEVETISTVLLEFEFKKDNLYNLLITRDDGATNKVSFNELLSLSSTGPR